MHTSLAVLCHYQLISTM